MVAAPDSVDGDRNIIFLRQRDDCQILNPKDPCLRLTGPCRAIVATDPVDFEIVLKVNGKIRSGDRVLMCQTFRYSGDYRRSPTTLLNDFCKIVLHIEKVEKTVQATVSDRGTEPSSERKDEPEQSKEVVLQDQAMANRSDGYVDLSRQVVSVELDGTLQVIIRDCSRPGVVTKQDHVLFKAQECKISRKKCDLGHCKVLHATSYMGGELEILSWWQAS
ncbi:hypothetical protein ACQ4PT_006969 [Festuca glaucescens]